MKESHLVLLNQYKGIIAGLFNTSLEEVEFTLTRGSGYYNPEPRVIGEKEFPDKDDDNARIHFELGSYTLRIHGAYLASWQLTQFPACHNLIISTNARVEPKVRKQGLGKILNKFRIEIARVLGHAYLICTYVTDNEPQIKILADNGWKTIFNFEGGKYNKNVNLGVIKL